MNRKEIEEQMQELKSDYIRIQGDLEKLESVGGKVSPLEKTLERIEQELSRLRGELAKLNKA